MENIIKKLTPSIVVTLVLSIFLPVSAFAAAATMVDLGSILTNNFVILSNTGITDATPAGTSITGNIGTALVASPAITGVSCTEVNGNVYILTTAGYAGGHDLNVTCLLSNNTVVAGAVGDMATAYTFASLEAPGTLAFLNAGSPAGTLNGQTLVAGVYTWSAPINVHITGNITLSGDANDVWVFQIPGTLIMDANMTINLSGGAQAKNIFWQVAGAVTIKGGATFEGNILAQTNIAMQAGAILHGRALAQTAVTLISNNISSPATAPAVVTPSGRRTITPIVPLIGILKVPSPLGLSKGPGQVTYNYTVWNVGMHQSLTGVTVVDDKCFPIILLSGDTDNNTKLDVNETWKYTCTSLISTTTTNTAIATGYSDDGYHNTAIATAIATVAVGTNIVPPLIHIVKIPSQLTPLPFGGGQISYAYTVTNPGVVPMNGISITDDKCSNVNPVSIDQNGNGLFDTNETWTYVCVTNIKVSTGGVVTARGDANNSIALAYAFANVLVSAPGLPDTGFGPEIDNFSWGTIALFCFGGLLTISLAVALIKQKSLF